MQWAVQSDRLFVLLCDLQHPLLALLPAVSAAAATTPRITHLCSTPGRVVGIACWLNDAGFVQALELEDDYSVRSPRLCGSSEQHATPPDVNIRLAAFESITEIVACE